MKRSIKLATVLAMAAAGVVATAAQARAHDSETRSIAVNVRDLDLATKKGQAALLRRIRWAADLVCGAPDTRELQLLAEYRNCVNEATNSALAKVKAAQLAQVQVPQK